jgi:hypothetical protein
MTEVGKKTFTEEELEWYPAFYDKRATRSVFA